MQEANQRVVAAEQQCMDAAVKRANDEFSQIVATPDASSEQRVKNIRVQRSHDLSKCKAEADHENEELSAREQAEYERQAQEQNDRATVLWVEHGQSRI
jgi:hypothetical protein